MITGVMLMTIMKITDDDWITKIVTMIIISTIILIMILKKIQKFKIDFRVELNATRTWDGTMSEPIFLKLVLCHNRICITS